MGNGEVSLKEMKDAVDEFGWKQFKDSPELVTQVFRYLDPDNGGSISLEEWDVLQQLWKELTLSILEFLKYIDLMFGDLDTAYDLIDQDSSDEVELHEWEQAVEEMGYFGASLAIYRYICPAGSQGFSHADWVKLEDLWSQRKELMEEILHGDS